MTHRINIKNRFRKHSDMPTMNPNYVKRSVVHSVQQEPALDDFEREYQKFIEEQKKIAAERKKKKAKSAVIDQEVTQEEV